MRVDHRLVIELLRMGGDLVGHVSITPDWDPAVEWTRLAGLRALGVWAPEAAAERAIEPLWHAGRGEPYLRGFRVHLAAREATAWHEDFPVQYFGGLAQAAAAQLVEQGAFQEGERFRYRTLAYVQHGRPDARPAVFATVDRPPPLPIRGISRVALLGASAPAGDRHADDFDVFMPADVIEEASALTARAGDVETGGVLLGHVGREDGTREICLEITALVPARHTVGAMTALTFTSETWTDARQTVELRRRNEMLVGWFHSHPQHAWCREKGCPIEQQRQCAAADGFFSTGDLALHRTMFPRAFTVALVMTHSAKGILPRLFGWRAGLFEPRGFRVLATRAATGDLTDARTTIAI